MLDRLDAGFSRQEAEKWVSDIQQRLIVLALQDEHKSDLFLERLLEEIDADDEQWCTESPTEGQKVVARALIKAFFAAFVRQSSIFFDAPAEGMWQEGVISLFGYANQDPVIHDYIEKCAATHCMTLFKSAPECIVSMLTSDCLAPHTTTAREVLLHNVTECCASNKLVYEDFLKKLVKQCDESTSDVLLTQIVQAVHTFITEVDFKTGVLLPTDFLKSTKVYKALFTRHKKLYQKLYVSHYLGSEDKRKKPSMRNLEFSQVLLLAPYLALLPVDCKEFKKVSDAARVDQGTVLDVVQSSGPAVCDVVPALQSDERLARYIDFVYKEKQALEDAGYIVFVHAQNSSLYLSSWWMTQLHALYHGTRATESFSFIRVQPFFRIEDEVQLRNDILNNPQMLASQGLFANCSLSGNLRALGESSLWYALANKNATHVTVPMRDVIDCAGFDTSLYYDYADRFDHLEKSYEAITTYGSLWLIALRPEDVADAVVVTRAFGKPINVAIYDEHNSEVIHTNDPILVIKAMRRQDGYAIVDRNKDCMDPIFVLSATADVSGVLSPENKIVRVITEHDANPSEGWSAFVQARHDVLVDCVQCAVCHGMFSKTCPA